MKTETARVAQSAVTCPRCRANDATRTGRTWVEKLVTKGTSYRKWQCNICDRTFWASDIRSKRGGKDEA